MSFVYAMNDVIFSIMSDTKIGIKDDLPKLWNSESEKRLVTQMGLMKSIIVLPNIVIGYAGNNINKAAELLRNVKNSSDNLEEIISAAFKIHTTSEEDAIEFIIAYCDENTRELISVKNQQVFRNCKVAWLGSREAYNEFKRLESLISENNVKGKKSITCTDNGEFLEEDLAEELVRAYKIEECFSEVVNSGIDPTVGGMTVRIRAMEGENTFQYMSGMNAIASNWPQIVKPDENINFYQGADKGSRFAQRTELPEIVTDYKTLYKDLGFDEEAIYNDRIYPIHSNGLHTDYTDGVIEKRINFSELDNYKIKVTVSCVAIKMETLWNSDEVCFCPNRERIKKYIPDLNEYRFAPINNEILAKVEIPFLIFERNKGKCFIEKH